eukprot:182914-Prorocentrum_lima.AAC.1
MVEISIAPIEQDIVQCSSEFGIGPDWEFLNLYPTLTEQLLKCRPIQETKEEPASAQQGRLSAGGQETQ